ncbi:DMT family transporter [Parachlamydia acanthamoebae]|jgi:drug/metabolite transporter (DMT)-like permease|nr:DMT family transporter [Parachlamydia acanthamoebae]
MIVGIAYMIGACLCWGLVFVIPNLFPDFSPFEIMLGRCFFYGMLSIGILLSLKRDLIFSLNRRIWIAGAILALVGSLIHYCSLVLSMRYVNSTIPTLLLGLTPVCMILIDIRKTKTKKLRDFFVPCTLILVGFIFVNIPTLAWDTNVSIENYAWGFFWSLVALATWICFIAGSANFLKSTSSLKASDWITVLGVATFLWTVLLCTSSLFFVNTSINHYFIMSNGFLLATALLGVCSSWLGYYMWNQATLRLPLSLAGQLSVLEIVFGLSFIHLANWKFPENIEILGIMTILSGIVLNLFMFQESAYQS